MSVTRLQTPGATKTCPHCKGTILASSSVCPACRHHLRFIRSGEAEAAPVASALRIEASIESPDAAAPSEYSVVVEIRNERGEEIARHVVNVGALTPGQQRRCVVSVDVSAPSSAAAEALRRDPRT